MKYSPGGLLLPMQKVLPKEVIPVSVQGATELSAVSAEFLLSPLVYKGPPESPLQVLTPKLKAQTGKVRMKVFRKY